MQIRSMHALAAMIAKALGHGKESRQKYIPQRNGFRTIATGVCGYAIHRLPRSKTDRKLGVRRTKKVPIVEHRLVDNSRYPGFVLRKIRADGQHR
jgi:hypothetical protein